MKKRFKSVLEWKVRQADWGLLFGMFSLYLIILLLGITFLEFEPIRNISSSIILFIIYYLLWGKFPYFEKYFEEV